VTAERRTVRIGITGPIGCGKSQVVRWLAELGAEVVDADDVARAVTAPGHPAHDVIVRRFGPAVTTPEGTLDRAALGRIVFSDPAALRELEQIVHPATRPLILASIDEAERAGAAAVAIEAIKLVEGGLAGLCDQVWVVVCSPEQQLARLLARGAARAAAEQRIAAQAGLADRLRPSATLVLETSGTLEETRGQVVRALGEAISSARQRRR
jgi:dephospho-CoA kinase